MYLFGLLKDSMHRERELGGERGSREHAREMG